MFKKMMSGVWSIIVTISLFLLGMFLVPVVWPVADEMIDRHRITGLWHVDGSFADWRFGRDGTFKEEALISSEGRYQLLSGDRIRITNALGSMQYKYRFDDLGLLLVGDGQPLSFRLTRKN